MRDVKTKDFYNHPEYILDFESLVFSIKRAQIDLGSSFNSKNKKIKEASCKISKKLRVTNINGPLDTLTFSRDFIDEVDTVLDLFNEISKKQMFNSKINSYVYEYQNFIKLPFWFNRMSLHSLAEWVVAHFEVQIYQYYKSYDEEEIFKMLAIQKRESYIDIWKGLKQQDRKEMIRNSLNVLKNFPVNFFIVHFENIDFNQFKNKNQAMLFKFIWDLNRLPFENIEQVKELLFDRIMEKRKALADSNFIRMCVAGNVKASLDITQFFMNNMVEFLEKLHFKQIFLFDIDEEVKKKRKKRKKKKKKKKKIKEKSKSISREKILGNKDELPVYPGKMIEAIDNPVDEFQETETQESIPNQKMKAPEHIKEIENFYMKKNAENRFANLIVLDQEDFEEQKLKKEKSKSKSKSKDHQRKDFSYKIGEKDFLETSPKRNSNTDLSHCKTIKIKETMKRSSSTHLKSDSNESYFLKEKPEEKKESDQYTVSLNRIDSKIEIATLTSLDIQSTKSIKDKKYKSRKKPHLKKKKKPKLKKIIRGENYNLKHSKAKHTRYTHKSK